MRGVQPLTGLQLEVLAFEHGRFLHAGSKANEIREWFGHDFSDTRYYQVLNTAIDQPAAEHYDPELVRRLRRLREARATQHGHRRLGGTP